jgi:hypothetical protein
MRLVVEVINVFNGDVESDMCPLGKMYCGAGKLSEIPKEEWLADE